MGDITLKKALTDYKTIYMSYRNFADRTRVEYLNDLEDLVKYAHGQGVEHVLGLGLAIIHRYIAQLEERGYSSFTRKRKVVAIRSFLGFLYQDDYIRTDVAARVVLPFTETSTPHILTQAECDRLRSTCTGNPRGAAIFELLLQTGIRLSELTHLTINDIDLGEEMKDGDGVDAFIRIVGSGSKKERMIPLNSRVCVALRNYLGARMASGNPILFLNRFGKPLGDRGVQKMIRKHFRNAGIGRAGVHTLRHTFAVRQVAKGDSTKMIQVTLGLKDLRSVAIYDMLAKAMVD